MLRLDEKLRDEVVRALLLSRPEACTVSAINQITQNLQQLQPIKEQPDGEGNDDENSD